MLTGMRATAARIAMAHGLQLLAYRVQNRKLKQDDKVKEFAQLFFGEAGSKRSELIDACINHVNRNMRYLAVISGYCDIAQLERIILKGRGRDKASWYAETLLQKREKLVSSTAL